MSTPDEVRTHGVAKSIALHLVPGVAIAAFYFLIRGPLERAGYPSILALMVAIPAILVPVELGYLLFRGRRQTGRFTLKGLVSYRRSLPLWEYFVWPLVVFVVAGLVFTLMKPVDLFLQREVFFWVPTLETGLGGGFERGPLLITYTAVAIFGVVIGPVVEELYFRGYLLPRTPGRLTILWHSLLFAAYHVFTPWMIVTRTIGLLPLIFAARKKNIWIGVIAHVLVNSIDAITGFAHIAGMS